MNTNLTGQEMVSYQTGAISLGNTTYAGTSLCDCYYHYWPAWYPTYHICEKSNIEQAFKIIGKLLEKKIITKTLTVKDFMVLVNDVAEVI